MVMSGEARLAYHSVPRVISTDVRTLACDDIVSNDEWEPYAEYMASSRVNLNIRQVLKPGEPFPEDSCATSGCSAGGAACADTAVRTDSVHAPAPRSSAIQSDSLAVTTESNCENNESNPASASALSQSSNQVAQADDHLKTTGSPVEPSSKRSFPSDKVL